MKQNQITNEWRRFLAESPLEEKEISDDILAILFSDEISALLDSDSINESLQDRAKQLARKYGIPVVMAVSLLTGGLAGHQIAKIQNAQPAQAQTQEIDPLSAARTSDLPPGYSDLSNKEGIARAWNDLESLERTKAPVTGQAPTLVDGQMKMLSFSYIPASELSDDTVLPMSLMTAGQYRAMWEAQVAQDSQEVLYLKNMIFGNTGKWASGTGNELFRVEGNTALLPPEWSIAHEVYATAVETRVKDVLEYIRQHPDSKESIYAELGVENDEQFHEFMNDQLYKIARQ